MKTEEFTAGQKLTICNMVQKGMRLKDARAKVAKENTPAKGESPEAPKRKTAAERKEALAAEIVALGGTPPVKEASIAQFNEALTAAKTAAEDVDKDMM